MRTPEEIIRTVQELDSLAVLETTPDTVAILSAMSLFGHWVVATEEGDQLPRFIETLNQIQRGHALLN